MLAVALIGNASIAQTNEEFNQQLGACSAQADKTKKSQCYERVARDAVAALSRQATQPTAPIAAISAPAIIPQAKKYSAFIEKAKANIAANLKDPASSQWRNTFVSDAGSKLLVLCGEVNAKNSYGAYIGFRRFFATAEPLLQEIENPKQPSIIEKMWPSMCMNELEKVD